MPLTRGCGSGGGGAAVFQSAAGEITKVTGSDVVRLQDSGSDVVQLTIERGTDAAPAANPLEIHTAAGALLAAVGPAGELESGRAGALRGDLVAHEGGANEPGVVRMYQAGGADFFMNVGSGGGLRYGALDPSGAPDTNPQVSVGGVSSPFQSAGGNITKVAIADQFRITSGFHDVAYLFLSRGINAGTAAYMNFMNQNATVTVFQIHHNAELRWLEGTQEAKLQSNRNSGVLSNAFRLETLQTLTAGNLLLIDNNGTEKFRVDFDGNLYLDMIAGGAQSIYIKEASLALVRANTGVMRIEPSVAGGESAARFGHLRNLAPVAGNETQGIALGGNTTTTQPVCLADRTPAGRGLAIGFRDSSATTLTTTDPLIDIVNAGAVQSRFDAEGALTLGLVVANRGSLDIQSGGTPPEAGILILHDETTQAHYLWFDNLYQRLRTHTGDPATSDLSGKFIGPSCYAGIYADDVSATQTLNAVAGTFNKVTLFTTNYGENQDLTADAANDKITIVQPGFYLIQVHVSFTGTVNRTYTLRLQNGVTVIPGSRLQRELGSTASIGSASIVCLETFAAADVIELYATGSTGSETFEVNEIQMVAVRIG